MKEPTDGPAGRPRMVEVGEKPDTRREATARGRVAMQPATLTAIQNRALPKGDVLATAQVAAIMAAKRTWEIVPMCHPLLLTGVEVAFQMDEARSAIDIVATVRTTGKTGVEMEALTAVSVAALTIYDMCKAIDPAMTIHQVHLVSKSGGKSGHVVLE